MIKRYRDCEFQIFVRGSQKVDPTILTGQNYFGTHFAVDESGWSVRIVCGRAWTCVLFVLALVSGVWFVLVGTASEVRSE